VTCTQVTLNLLVNFKGASVQVVKICNLNMLRAELKNVIEYGLIKHRGDFHAEWMRTSRGTLSWEWF